LELCGCWEQRIFYTLSKYMAKNKFSIWGWLVVGACACVSLSHARTFTDTNGRKIEATIEKEHENKVDLKMEKGGKVYTVPFSKLSQADNGYIQEWKAKNEEVEGKGEAPPQKKSARSAGRWRSTAAIKKEYGLKDNFDAPWPKLISGDISVEIEEDTNHGSTKQFIYRSPNYEFVSDVRLSRNVVKKFATLFESTREFCHELPISLMKAHVPGERFRNKIFLFEHKSTYIENGGPPDSAGVFIGRKGEGVVMVPLVSLGVKKVGSGYMFDYDGLNKTLPHELTHQLTDNEYFEVGARGWFSEGLAEYVANTSYRSGKFMVKSNLSSIKAFVTEYGKKGRGGRGLGDEIQMTRLKEYMLQPYSSFTGNSQINYGMGLLITYYYFHWDGKKDRANITAFLKALKEGKRGEEALKVLLNGRSWEEMEKAISKAWRSRGVRIKFS